MREMSETEAANDAVTRNLMEAIERVRDDVEKVEFWAGAVAGFARPLPDYDPNEASVWLPAEQASTLRSRMGESKSLREPKSGRRKSGTIGKSSPSKPRARSSD